MYYDVCRETGSFIIVDRMNNGTAGAAHDPSQHHSEVA